MMPIDTENLILLGIAAAYSILAAARVRLSQIKAAGL
jgi:hypothetical protein